MPSSTTQLLYFVQSKIMLQCRVKYFHWVKFLQLLLEMFQNNERCVISFNIITARKRSLRRLCFYTCLSFCPRGGCSHGGVPARGVPVPGGSAPRGCLLWGCLLQGGLLPGGCGDSPPVTATAVGGTHPTGMHSCI